MPRKSAANSPPRMRKSSRLEEAATVNPRPRMKLPR
jgi:hypothetical protein